MLPLVKYIIIPKIGANVARIHSRSWIAPSWVYAFDMGLPFVSKSSSLFHLSLLSYSTFLLIDQNNSEIIRDDQSLVEEEKPPKKIVEEYIETYRNDIMSPTLLNDLAIIKQ